MHLLIALKYFRKWHSCSAVFIPSYLIVGGYVQRRWEYSAHGKKKWEYATSTSNFKWIQLIKWQSELFWLRWNWLNACCLLLNYPTINLFLINFHIKVLLFFKKGGKAHSEYLLCAWSSAMKGSGHYEIAFDPLLGGQPMLSKAAVKPRPSLGKLNGSFNFVFVYQKWFLLHILRDSSLQSSS